MIRTLGKNDSEIKAFRENIFIEDLDLPIECMRLRL